MEVTLIQESVFSLPSKLRVGAIIFDGAADMQLWPGPGPEKDLKEVYGDNLQTALDTEYKQLGGDPLPLGTVVRVSPGRLHCDFLGWVATREPEPGTERHPAPDEEAIMAAVTAALEFVATRNVKRVGFAPLGHGPDEMKRELRLATIVKAATQLDEKLFAEGKSLDIDEILVCEPMKTVFKKASTKVRGLAKAKEREEKKAKAAAKKTTKKRAPRKPKTPVLPPDEIETRRLTAERYSVKANYVIGDWFLHPKFGMGRVEQLPLPGACIVLYEDGKERRMVHGRG